MEHSTMGTHLGFEPKEGAVEEVEKSHKVERIVKHRVGLDSENILTSRLRRH
jgi:hypothetical protein